MITEFTTTQLPVRRVRFYIILVAFLLTAPWNDNLCHSQERLCLRLSLQQNLSIYAVLDQETSQDALTVEQTRVKLKSERTAFNLSLFGTLSSFTLVLAPFGLIVGPSLGYFYGGMPWRGLATVGIRIGLLVGAMGGAWAICGWDCSSGDDAYDVAWVVLGAGMLLFISCIIYDIASVKGAVRKHNQSLQEKGLTVTPKFFTNSKAVGLGINLKF